MSNNGWIRLHRSSFNNRLYFSEPFTRWQAWVDLLLLANHKSGTFRVRGIMVEVLRGQTGFSSVELADRWRWSRGKVNRFLVELKNEHQIIQQKSNVTTLISIVNYERYQSDGTANGTEVGTQVEQKTVQQTVQQTDINNKNNNINNTKMNQKEREGVSPYPPPDSVSGYNFLPNGKSYIEREVFFTKEDFGDLPVDKSVAIKDILIVSKKVEVSEDDLAMLWNSFKTMNLTFQKAYRNKDDVYNHFYNWCKTQSFLKSGRVATKKKEEEKDKPIYNLQNVANRYD